MASVKSLIAKEQQSNSSQPQQGTIKQLKKLTSTGQTSSHSKHLSALSKVKCKSIKLSKAMFQEKLEQASETNRPSIVQHHHSQMLSNTFVNSQNESMHNSSGFNFPVMLDKPLKKQNSQISFLSEYNLRENNHSCTEAVQLDTFIQNKETLNFLKRHFLAGQQQLSQTNYQPICYSWFMIPLAYFVRLLLTEYPDVIEQNYLQEELLNELKGKLREMLRGDDNSQEFVSLQKLNALTCQTGLLSLLIKAIRELNEQEIINQQNQNFYEFQNEDNENSEEKQTNKDSQGNVNTTQKSQETNQEQIKNFIQNFMEMSFQEKSQLLMAKFNTFTQNAEQKEQELKTLLNRVQQKYSNNFDLFQHETRMQNKISGLEEQIKLLTQKNKILEQNLQQKEDEIIKQQKKFQQELENNKKLTPKSLKSTKTVQTPDFDKTESPTKISPMRSFRSNMTQSPFHKKTPNQQTPLSDCKNKTNAIEDIKPLFSLMVTAYQTIESLYNNIKEKNYVNLFQEQIESILINTLTVLPTFSMNLQYFNNLEITAFISLFYSINMFIMELKIKKGNKVIISNDILKYLSKLSLANFPTTSLLKQNKQMNQTLFSFHQHPSPQLSMQFEPLYSNDNCLKNLLDLLKELYSKIDDNQLQTKIQLLLLIMIHTNSIGDIQFAIQLLLQNQAQSISIIPEIILKNYGINAIIKGLISCSADASKILIFQIKILLDVLEMIVNFLLRLQFPQGDLYTEYIKQFTTLQNLELFLNLIEKFQNEERIFIIQYLQEVLIFHLYFVNKELGNLEEKYLDFFISFANNSQKNSKFSKSVLDSVKIIIENLNC